MQEIINLYLLLLCVVCSLHTHTLRRGQSLLWHFAHSHCTLQIAEIKEMSVGTSPSRLRLSENALNDGFWVLFLIIHTWRHWSKSNSVVKTTYFIMLFHQIGLYQYVNFCISNRIHCQLCTVFSFSFQIPKIFGHLPRRKK